MEFDEFKTYVKNSIKFYLPEEFRTATVELYNTQKLNEQYTALLVMKEGETVAPTMNLNHFYGEYQQNGNVGEVLRRMAELITVQPPELDVSTMLLNYEEAKKKLFFRVNAVKGNEGLLATCPHTKIDDLAITYHVEVDNRNNRDLGSMLVTDTVLEHYGITKEQLHQDAMENSPRIHEARFGEMNSPLFNINLPVEETEYQGHDDGQDGFLGMMVPMYILTNEQLIFGAATLFYPGMMDQIAEKIKDSFYVLPSSVHEQLIVPAAFVEEDSRYLDDMVEEVNYSVVDPHERLTDHAYHYDSKDKIFERATAYEARKREKQEMLDRLNKSKDTIPRNLTGKPKKDDMSL